MYSWKLKPLLLCHLITALLIGTFLWPVTHVYWEQLDLFFFKHLNGSLRDNPNWQVFWALANHKWADWVEDVFILGFFAVYVRGLPKELRLKGICQMLFSVLCIAFVLYFVNRILFRENLIIYRDSPTLVVDTSVHLSDEISWLRIKDEASRSFPADHATTAILFATLFTYFAGWRLGLIACFYAAFLCLPRLITGAHWLTDILVGSGPITLLCLGWALCSPLPEWCTHHFEHFFRSLKGLKKKWLTL
jgi:membrane-associated phospholipid phosphatase